MDELDKKEEEQHSPKGSLVLALVFLAFFVLMWLANYQLLGSSWGVR